MKGGKIGFVIGALAALAIVGYSVWTYLYGNPNSTPLTEAKQATDINYQFWLGMLLTHIITACIATVIGPLQFLKKLQAKKKLHRTLGKIYAVSILISAIIGLYLAYHASFGIFSKLGFAGLDIAWLVTTGMGIVKIRKKEIVSHKKWMIRSFAVTLASITFRLTMAIMSLIGIDMVYSYPFSTWFCWIGNLLLVELFFLKGRSYKKKT